MVDWTKICDIHWCEPAQMADGSIECPACWWHRNAPKVVIDLPEPIPFPRPAVGKTGEQK